MSKSNVNGPEGRETIEDPVTELLRVGAQQLIQRAVEAELLLSQIPPFKTKGGFSISPDPIPDGVVVFERQRYALELKSCGRRR